jgi:hypothetical protein
MTRDDLRDGMALICARLADDADGQRIIRENARTDGLIDALLLACDFAVRLLAEHDGVPPGAAIGKMQEKLRHL